MKIDKRHVEQFIRDKVEKEALTDTEIARLLNVATSTVSHWRNNFQIKPADKFPRHFTKKYGDDALDKFHAMVRDRASLTEISRSFGFSREYARQVYGKLYDAPFYRKRGHRPHSLLPTQ